MVRWVTEHPPGQEGGRRGWEEGERWQQVREVVREVRCPPTSTPPREQLERVRWVREVGHTPSPSSHGVVSRVGERREEAMVRWVTEHPPGQEGGRRGGVGGGGGEVAAGEGGGGGAGAPPALLPRPRPP